MLIPGPDTRVVELRVHGILGTEPEALVDAVAAVDVAGDGLGRVVRPADRLRRPAPGPVLKADGRPLPRTLEGYVWGGMTSGGWSKAIWALLFPFSLANVASWMLPPVPTGSRAGHWLGAVCRALLRLAALLLTLLLVEQMAAITVDLLAAQCLAPGGRCLAVVPDWIRTAPFFRTGLGLVPMALLVLVLARVSQVNWQASARTPEPSTEGLTGRMANLPGAHRIADPDAPALRTLHLTAALAAVALLTVGGPLRPDAGGWVTVCWIAALVLVLVCVAGVIVLGDPTGNKPQRSGQWLLAALSPVPRRLLLTAAVLLLGGVVAARPHLASPLPGTGPTLTVTTLALGGVCIAVGLLLIPAALLARPRWAGQPSELRPWAGGWLAAPFLALAALLGGGFGAGIGITIRRALGNTGLALPHGYAYLTLLWGIAGGLAVVGVLVLGVLLLTHKVFLGARVPALVALLHVDRPADAAAAAPAWRMANWERRHAHHVLLGLTGVLAVGAVVSAVPWLNGVLPPAWTQPLAAFGLVALAFLAVALLREVYAATRNPNSARHLGGLSDLCCFWPREAHPVVPPCYALKVVPELAARAAEHLADPGARVVLAGHSQGTVIAIAAATRLLGALTDQDSRRLGVVVAGSPLQWAYPRAFPGVVPHDGLLRLYHDLEGRWRVLSRGTDPIGGGLTTWRRQVFDGKLIGVGFRTDGTEGALPPAVLGPTGAQVLGGDHWLPDPQRGPFAGRRWHPGVQVHQDYWSDPEWDRAVACAAGMQSPTETGTQEAVFRLPGRPNSSAAS